MESYIGLDAHASSCTLAVIGPNGKRLGSHVVETNAKALIDVVRSIPGRRQLCLEEGTLAGWLHEVLSPHVEELVVAAVSESRGPKSDQSVCGQGGRVRELGAALVRGVVRASWKANGGGSERLRGRRSRVDGRTGSLASRVGPSRRIRRRCAAGDRAELRRGGGCRTFVAVDGGHLHRAGILVLKAASDTPTAGSFTADSLEPLAQQCNNEWRFQRCAVASPSALR